MGNQELKETFESMDSVLQELVSSDEKALAFLVEAGILRPDGRSIHDETPTA